MTFEKIILIVLKELSISDKRNGDLEPILDKYDIPYSEADLQAITKELESKGLAKVYVSKDGYDATLTIKGMDYVVKNDPPKNPVKRFWGYISKPISPTLQLQIIIAAIGLLGLLFHYFRTFIF